MTDIRNDFENNKSWRYQPSFARFPSPDDNEYSNEAVQLRWEGYQAGRAHGVDELIAEIESLKYPHPQPYKDTTNEAFDKCITVIRKHFGKE